MVNFKDHINKTEAIHAMEQLGKIVQQYREQRHSTPPESFLNQQKDALSAVRLGEVRYRAQWIGFDADPDTILAYSYKNYKFLVKRGYVVMRLDGSVEWMVKKEFEQLLKKQQNQAEIELLLTEQKP
jgi:hypothetical protein